MSNLLIIQKFYYKFEIQLIIALAIIGCLTIPFIHNLIGYFISLELIGFSINFLILIQGSYKNNSNTAFIYLIINGISSIIFLLGILLIYKDIGTFDINDMIIFKGNNN